MINYGHQWYSLPGHVSCGGGGGGGNGSYTYMDEQEFSARFMRYCGGSPDPGMSGLGGARLAQLTTSRCGYCGRNRSHKDGRTCYGCGAPA